VEKIGKKMTPNTSNNNKKIKKKKKKIKENELPISQILLKVMGSSISLISRQINEKYKGQIVEPPNWEPQQIILSQNWNTSKK
jgi:hypothetical protein